MSDFPTGGMAPTRDERNSQSTGAPAKGSTNDGPSDLGGLFTDENGQNRLPTYDEIRYILIAAGVPEAAANAYAAGDAWKAQALSNPSGFVEWLADQAPAVIQADRERQQAENRANAPTPKPTKSPAPALPQQPSQPGGSGVLGNLAGNAASTPVDVDQEVRDNFPAFAWLLDDPEIGQLLRDSVTEGWTVEKFQARLYGTNWWKNHSEPVRKWDTLRKVDAAEANRQLGARQAELWDLAFRMTGKKPNPNQIKMLAEYSLRFGLSDAQVRDQLVSVTKIGMGIGGEGLTVLNQLREIRDAYTLPVHGQAMYDWTRQILAGEDTVDGFKAWALERARGLFAGNKEMDEALLAGKTVRQLAGSYIEMAAQELGVNPDSISLTDDRWMRALHHTDPENGKRRMMNLDEWRRELRTKGEYGYDKTTNARSLAAQMRSAIDETFGLAG